MLAGGPVDVSVNCTGSGANPVVGTRIEIRYRLHGYRGQVCVDINCLVFHRVLRNILGIRIITILYQPLPS